LRPLSYPDPDRLVRIYNDSPPNKFSFSVADFLALASQQTQFEQVAGYTNRAMTFTNGTTAERVRAKTISWSFCSVLGIKPAIGRDFVEDDGRAGNPPAVLVSHRFWTDRLAARDDVVGRPIRLDGTNYTVVGILPAVVGPLEQDRDLFAVAQWTAPPRK